ncbi:08184886-f5fe-4055-9e53-f60f265b43be [Sclerotinia trifoliorum]|uniref:08184886-f5fe-4055-9e53-f60f265b43be n=1 Tax=Sclerotinia trifoliorum TaxID=28548 RepID=A0A8H2W0A8_9HELO|nr:08184886-f5fe-4055-9e53-f60f265b43be [Sclerotinia trifoliorum]
MAPESKILELKVRPYQAQSQERPDFKNVARVYVCTDVLLDLQVRNGETCYLWKSSEGEHTRREAVIWLAAEKLSRKVVQVSKAFQEACGFKLSDDVIIARAGKLEVAKDILIKDIGMVEGVMRELSGDVRIGWRCILEDLFARAELIYPGMTFRDVMYRREKRTFEVFSIDGSKSGVASFFDDGSSSVKIATIAEISGAVLAASNVEQKPLQVVDIAGIDQALGKLNKFLSNFNRQFYFTKVRRSPAVLLHGGRGTGKTFVLDKLACTEWGKVRKIDRKTKPSEVQKIFKDSKINQPSIIIIDDLESVVTKGGEPLLDMTEAICEGFEDLAKDEPPNSLPQVVVAAATSDMLKIPAALRKRGRFTTAISLPVPDAAARKAILKSLNPQMCPETRDEILHDLGERTHAYTPEDLALLLDEAHIFAEDKLDVENLPEQKFIVKEDIEHALLEVRPSAMHDITLRPPKVKWSDIGGQDKVKEAIQLAIETPFHYQEIMQDFGRSPTKGLLLYGPPGCSKTLTAQAVATEMGFNFFAVKGAELLSKYVGDSERAVRNIFSRARAAAPSIIFFDEIESIGGKRDGKNSNNGVNVLTTLLNEMDGIESLKGVTVLAATNKPQDLDLALLRPGRFDELIYVAPPDLAGREAIIRARQRESTMAKDVDIAELARLTEGYSGAEMVSICQKAFDAAIERRKKNGTMEPAVMNDFLTAMPKIKRQITPDMLKEFEKWAKGE